MAGTPKTAVVKVKVPIYIRTDEDHYVEVGVIERDVYATIEFTPPWQREGS